MKYLPRKASAGVRLAIKDLIKVEADKKYKVDMTTWHQRGYDGGSACSVCLAGAVMAMSLGVERTRTVQPNYGDFGEVTVNKLEALDSFRKGYITSGLQQYLGYTDVGHKAAAEANLRDRKIVPYAENPEKFKRQMLAMADRLESIGQ